MKARAEKQICRKCDSVITRSGICFNCRRNEEVAVVCPECREPRMLSKKSARQVKPGQWCMKCSNQANREKRYQNKVASTIENPVKKRISGWAFYRAKLEQSRQEHEIGIETSSGCTLIPSITEHTMPGVFNSRSITGIRPECYTRCRCGMYGADLGVPVSEQCLEAAATRMWSGWDAKVCAPKPLTKLDIDYLWVLLSDPGRGDPIRSTLLELMFRGENLVNIFGD